MLRKSMTNGDGLGFKEESYGLWKLNEIRTYGI